MNEFNMNWLKEALLLAEKAEAEDEVPVGAVVIHQGQIVGKGYNLREQKQNPIAHAEILAIQDASMNLGTWRLNDCILVVTLEPCLMCLAASQQARVKEIYYGAKDPKGGALSLGFSFHEDRRMNHRFSANYVEYPQCGHILTEFFAKKRRT
jgi:tRNA(adenine34) deaminase